MMTRRASYRNSPRNIHGEMVGDPTAADRFDWQVDVLRPYRILDLADGDGTAPDVGPALTKAGTVTPGLQTGLVLQNGRRITYSAFSGGGRYTSVVDVDPDVGADFVFALLVYTDTAATGEPWFATRISGAGFQVYQTGPSVLFYSADSGGYAQSATTAANGLHLISGEFEYGASQRLYRDGTKVDTDSVAALTGKIGAGLGVGIMAKPNGVLPCPCELVRVMYWAGVGIVPGDAWHEAVAASVFPV